ncbi:transposase, partial [Flavobacterium sp. ST-75]
MYNKSKVVFKDYNPKQNFLLPPSLEELIEENHPVRTVSDVIDGLDLQCLIKNYKPGGTSSYHPRMLLKVLVYGYLCNIFSSRRLEEALKQNIHFMWLSGMSRPDHNTINRFRSERLKDEIQSIFTQVVLLLESQGHV